MKIADVDQIKDNLIKKGFYPSLVAHEFKIAPTENFINVEDDDFGCILNCAIRYAIGRRTYITSLVCDFITPLLPHLSSRTLKIIESDISQADSYGDEKIDKPVWMKLLNDVGNELNNRNGD